MSCNRSLRRVTSNSPSGQSSSCKVVQVCIPLQLIKAWPNRQEGNLCGTQAAGGEMWVSAVPSARAVGFQTRLALLCSRFAQAPNGYIASVEGVLVRQIDVPSLAIRRFYLPVMGLHCYFRRLISMSPSTVAVNLLSEAIPVLVSPLPPSIALPSLFCRRSRTAEASVVIPRV